MGVLLELYAKPEQHVFIIMKQIPEISIIIEAQGSREGLKQTLQSLDEQSFTHWEAILILDVAAHELPASIRNMLDQRFKLLSFSRAENLAQAQNLAIKKARAKYIALVRGGDLLLPLRLEKQYHFMEDNLGIGACASDIQWITREVAHVDRLGKALASRPQELICRILWELPIYPNTLMVRGWIARKHPFQARFSQAMYYEWLSRIKQDCPLANIAAPLVAIRANPDSATGAKPKHTFQDRRLIWAQLLRELGFRGDGPELDLHTQVLQKHSDIKSELAKEVEDWLHRLLLANQTHRVYPQEAFRQYLQEHWLKFMAGATRWGIVYGQQFSRSPLSPYPEYSFWQKSRFWARAFFRRY